MKRVYSAIGPVTNDLSQTSPSGTVVLTINGGTSTIGQFDVLLIGGQSDDRTATASGLRQIPWVMNSPNPWSQDQMQRYQKRLDAIAG